MVMRRDNWPNEHVRVLRLRQSTAETLLTLFMQILIQIESCEDVSRSHLISGYFPRFDCFHGDDC